MSILTRKLPCGCEVQYVPIPRAPWLPPREQWGEMCATCGPEYRERHARAAADHQENRREPHDATQAPTVS